MSSEAELRPSTRLRTLGIAAWASMAVALACIFFVAQEAEAAAGGPLQRIFYIHVPAAWAAYLGFAITFIASIAHLRTDSRRWDLLAHAAAEVGVLFGALVLITGPIWARPVWGTWWQWDARLTSTLVLWMTYAGYLSFRAFAADQARAGRPAAVIGIIGFINVPIVHFSIYWWRTLHPSGPTPANLAEESGLGGPELTTFFVSLAAITLLSMWLVAVRVRLGHISDTVEQLELSRASRAPATT
jgi:heme exporter protein C